MRSVNLYRLSFLLWMMAAAAPLAGWSQNTFRETEESSYRLYLEKNWDSLITIGHRAIRHDIDYYFLRTRMGIAYDARGQFIRSAWQYDQALRFNRKDPFATGQRYLALSNANRPLQARAVQATMTREQRELLCEKSPVLNFVSLDLGYTFSNAYSKISTGNLMGPDSIYGEADLYGDNYFANLALGFNISKRFTLIAGYTYLNFAKRKTIQYSYLEDQLDSTLLFEWGFENYYSFPRVSRDYPIDYYIIQHEFSLGGVIALDQGVKIMPVFRMISAKYNDTRATYSSAVVMDTSYYINGSDTYYTFPFTRSHYSVADKDTSFYNYLFSLAATRDFDFLTVGMSGSWSNLNGTDQLQASGFVTWYPLGNLDLYGTTGATMLSEEGDGRMLFSQMVGGKITKWLWAEGDFIWGDLSNGNTSNGWVVYNNSGRIRYRAGASLILTVIRNMEFTFNYQFFEKESPVYQYEIPENGKNGPAVMKTTWQNYQAHNMFIGIRVRI